MPTTASGADRDWVTVREHAVAGTLLELLPVLDAIGQARDHGELSGGFKSVRDSLQAVAGKLGLASHGQRGDAFDPKIHEALTHTYPGRCNRGHLWGDLPAGLQGRRADPAASPRSGRRTGHRAGRKRRHGRLAVR